MGLEARCVAHKGKETTEGLAHLDTDHLLFRGGFRLKVLFADIKSVKAESGRLLLSCAEGQICFELGAAAGKWADKILHPPSRLDKLGVKQGSSVVILGIEDNSFSKELAERTDDVLNRLRKGASVVFLGASKKADLRKLGAIRSALEPGGMVWIVYPKGVKDITQQDVFDAARPAGLVDVKVCRFSDSHTALKFVIPAAERSARRK
jgi:hypothetical protein